MGAIVALGSTAGASTPNAVSCTAGSGTTCFSVTTSAQNGIKGTTSASSGVGIIGKQTAPGGTGAGIVGSSNSGNILFPGVDGESAAASGSSSDAGGAFGLTAITSNQSPAGPKFGVVAYGNTYGIVGQIVSSSGGAGVEGFAPSGSTAGVEGINSAASGGYGVIGSNSDGNGYGVFGSSQGGDGAKTNTLIAPAYSGGYFVNILNATSDSGNPGPRGPEQPSSQGFGVVGDSDATAGLFINRSTYNINNQPPQTPGNFASQSGVYDELAVEPQGYALYESYLPTTGGPAISNFSVDQQGNILATSITTTDTGGPVTYTRSRYAAGAKLGEYAAHSAAPIVEDVGEAQLVNGRVLVQIEPRFASVMSTQTRYHVFLTPEGDGNGLYVTQKSQASFVVAEQHGGHSAMAFDYRIVADAYGSTGSRLPLMTKRSTPDVALRIDAHTAKAAMLAAHGGRIPQLLPPDKALLKELGPVRYQKAINAYRANLSK